MRMLGRYTSGGCWSGGRIQGRPCITPGPDCSGWDRDTRRRKRVEQRRLAREFAAAAAFYDTGEGRDWLELGLAEAEDWPGWDPSDCQHGCSGSPSCTS